MPAYRRLLNMQMLQDRDRLRPPHAAQLSPAVQAHTRLPEGLSWASTDVRRSGQRDLWRPHAVLMPCRVRRRAAAPRAPPPPAAV